ncbi:MAG: TonB-dependent receptor [Steroidobacteraceae bacterium]
MKRVSMLTWSLAATWLAVPGGSLAAAADEVAEVVVTARKVEERLLDVPLTITTFSAEDLQQAGAASINDLASTTPGLFVSSALGSRSSDRIALRGVSAVAGTAGFVGIYIDGVYLPSSFAQSLELSNVERVEVLKGPQSAIFGRATLSGAINYITRRPGEEWEGRATASVAEFGHYDLSASAGGPIAEGWGLLVGARRYSRDSLYFNQLTQTKDVGGQESTSATLGLSWKPTDTFNAYLRVLLSNDDDEAPAAYVQNSLFNNCLPATSGGTPLYYCGEVLPDAGAIRYTTSNAAVPAPFVGTFQDDGRAGLDRDSGRAALQLEWDLGNVVLSSVTSYGRDKVRDGTDLTTRAAFAYGPTVAMLPSITFDRDVRFEDYSQELRASVDNGGKWSGLAGAYVYHEERTESLPYRTGPASFAGTRSADNYALFGRLQFDPTDRLSLAAEARWQNDEIQLVNKFLTNNIDITVKTDSFLPRFTADYKLAEDLMVYAVASKGTKPATINTAPDLVNCPERQKTNEEEARNFELGLKGRLFDRRLTFQAAVFKIDWTEQEYSGILQPGDCGNNTAIIRFTANAGETTIEGVEARGHRDRHSGLAGRPAGLFDQRHPDRRGSRHDVDRSARGHSRVRDRGVHAHLCTRGRHALFRLSDRAVAAGRRLRRPGDQLAGAGRVPVQPDGQPRAPDPRHRVRVVRPGGLHARQQAVREHLQSCVHWSDREPEPAARGAQRPVRGGHMGSQPDRRRDADGPDPLGGVPG